MDGVEETLAALEQLTAALAAVDVGLLSLDQTRALALGTERLAGRLRGVASRALGEVAEREPEGVAWWWRDGLGISGEAAGHAVRRATKLRSMPLVEDAVPAGELSLSQAGALTPLVDKLDPAELAALEANLITEAALRTVDGVSRLVREIIAARNEPALVLEQEEAQRRRLVKYRQCADGMIRGRFALAAEDAEGVLSVLEPLSRRQGDDDLRTIAQRRADAFVDVFVGAARWMALPHAGGQRANLAYVMSWDWAAGHAGAQPATGAWTGPQTRSRIEAVLCDSRISRVLLDEHGQVIKLEAVTDQISRGQRRAVSARDRCCVVQGCNRPPAFCDIHHLWSRKDGGPTVLGNLALLCRRHHTMWHAGTITYAQLRIPWHPLQHGDPEPDDPPLAA